MAKEKHGHFWERGAISLVSTMATANVGLGFQDCPFQEPESEVSGQVLLLCGVPHPFFCLSFSLPTLLSLPQGGCEKMAEDCGKMLPGTPGVSDAQGKLIRI